MIRNSLTHMDHSELMTCYEPHCVKSVQIRSYFWSLFSCIWTEYRKIRTGNNSLFGHFSRSASFKTFVKYIKIWVKVGTFFITYATQKKKFSIKYFFRKCDQIRSYLRIWSHLQEKSLMENFIFLNWSSKVSKLTK